MNYRCTKPCIYLYILAVLVLSVGTVGYPYARRNSDAIQRHEVRIQQMEQMQDDLRSNTVAVARMAEAVDRLTKRMDKID